ncbi:MAG TPA: hypothetical protein VJ044_18555 [Candidatus Hodarchaeales archaeon]|nr:hypothetical protein [Candidatus Hodarchaeales archaeon]
MTVLPSYIVVAGLLEKHSGKTTFVGKLGRILARHLEVIPFKPISGSNYWHHSDMTRQAVVDRVLLSRDLKETCAQINYSGDLPYTLLNPIHTLFYPLGIGDYFTGTKKAFMNFSTVDSPILIRYSLWKGSEEHRVHAVRKNLDFPRNLNGLVQHADEIKEFSSNDDLTSLDKILSTKAIETSHEAIIKAREATNGESCMIVESFNNYLPPLEIIRFADTILFVGQGHVLRMPSEKVKQACKYFGEGFYTSGRTLDLVRPESHQHVPFDGTDDEWEMLARHLDIID